MNAGDPHHGPAHPCCGVSTNLEDYFLTRRQFLNRVGLGLGALGLATLLDPLPAFAAPAAAAGPGPLLPKAPHFPGRAKAVIHIFAQGAPSHVDTWDPKPELARLDGQNINGDGVAMASPFAFQRHGKSGLEVSELFARTAAHADDLAVIRSMYTDIPAHDVATVFMNTGSVRITKPSLGSWVVYGLGTENQNLPGFISLRGNRIPTGGATTYGSAFLPGIYQGTSVNTTAQNVQQMIQNIRNAYVSKAEQRRQLDFIHQLNDLHAQALAREAALESRLETYEIAFRMQAEATDAFDVNKEPADVRAAYGESQQGRQLLIARRLVERGVRFVQVWHDGWDHHDDLEDRITQKAGEIDQPLAALLADLKLRGLLDCTLVTWGGEFGRKPTRDRNGGESPGRDHNAKAFSVVLAGGGVKGGIVHGATDELGAAAVQDKVHVHDLHATILHALGFDHKKLTYRHNGRDFRLTDVAGNVVHPIFA
ncbi:MAG TPA: DUF1501 domain-containing protein [Opitutaceae bacterium]|nr:DUF1501 domain-containing protein [Opitutaceae bacterium]